MHWFDINENAYEYLRLHKIKKKDLKLLFFVVVNLLKINISCAVRYFLGKT